MAAKYRRPRWTAPIAAVPQYRGLVQRGESAESFCIEHLRTFQPSEVNRLDCFLRTMVQATRDGGEAPKRVLAWFQENNGKLALTPEDRVCAEKWLNTLARYPELTTPAQ